MSSFFYDLTSSGFVIMPENNFGPNCLEIHVRDPRLPELRIFVLNSDYHFQIFFQYLSFGSNYSQVMMIIYFNVIISLFWLKSVITVEK